MLRFYDDEQQPHLHFYQLYCRCCAVLLYKQTKIIINNTVVGYIKKQTQTGKTKKMIMIMFFSILHIIIWLLYQRLKDNLIILLKCPETIPCFIGINDRRFGAAYFVRWALFKWGWVTDQGDEEQLYEETHPIAILMLQLLNRTSSGTLSFS